jgi:hypothetical protein
MLLDVERPAWFLGNSSCSQEIEAQFTVGAYSINRITRPERRREEVVTFIV